MTSKPTPSMAEFFGWRRHPFSDTYPVIKPFLGEKDSRLRARAVSLLCCGKSFAITGPSGAGKSTLAAHIVASLDPHSYRPAWIHYGGLQRNGILKAIADVLGVDSAGRSVPLLVKLQKHIQQLAAEHNPLYPVLVVDDAQLLERDSLMDLCSLMMNPHKKTVAASVILIGDENLNKTLQLHLMTAVRTRLTGIFVLEPLDEKESEDFISFRLENAQAPPDLFEREALEIIAAHCRGNRRQIMNASTLLLAEAFLRQEKTVGSQLILSCDSLDISG